MSTLCRSHSILKASLLCLASSRGYSIFFSLHKPEWHVPSTPPAGRKTAPTERRDSGQTQEFSRGSRQASTSSDVTAPEEEERGGDEEPEGEEMKHDYDCVVMWHGKKRAKETGAERDWSHRWGQRFCVVSFNYRQVISRFVSAVRAFWLSRQE